MWWVLPLREVSRTNRSIGTVHPRGVTMVCLVVFSVLSVTGTTVTTRGVVSIVTLATSGGCILAPASHTNLSCFEHGPIWVARAELGVE